MRIPSAASAGAATGNAGVEDGQVQAAEAGHGRGDRVEVRPWVGDVGPHRETGAGRGDRHDGILRRDRFGAVDDGHVVAAGGQPIGDRGTDAARAARDQGDRVAAGTGLGGRISHGRGPGDDSGDGARTTPRRRRPWRFR